MNSQRDDELTPRPLSDFELQANAMTDDLTISALDAELDTLSCDLRLAPRAPGLDGEIGCFRAIELATRVVDEIEFPRKLVTETESEHELGDIGPYKLVRLINRGGMGMVYQALHQRLNKTVALKLMMPQRAENQDWILRFDREMKAVGMLDHVHLVRAVDAGEADGRHYLVMEYVDGCDLARLIRERSPIPIKQACELVRQAALGLQAAHARGIIHRDVKPANLILARQDFDRPVVKVLDLGLALLALHHAPDQHSLTSECQIMGSIDYIAPEQASNGHAVDPRVDVYGLGATLFALLTGGSSFSDQHHLSLIQKLSELATKPAPDVSIRRPDVNPELAGIVRRMMARDPADRICSMSEVITALEPHAAGADLESLLADQVGVSPTAPQIVSPAPAAAKLSSTSVVPNHRYRGPVIAAAFLVIAFLCGLIVLNISTPKGQVVVELPDNLPPGVIESLQINVRGTGKVLIASQKNGWKITANEGGYEVQLEGAQDQFAVENQQVLVNRNQPVIVRVIPKPAASQSSNPATEIAKTAVITPKTNTARQRVREKSADVPPVAIAPFDAQQARHHQQAWATYLDVPVEFTNSVGMKFKLIPPGEYMMGTSQGEVDKLLEELKPFIDMDERIAATVRSENPPVRVVLPKGLYVGAHEVTQNQYYLVTGKSPSSHVLSNPEYGPRLQGLETSEFPVESVSWYDMIEFCEKLSQLEHFAPFASRTGDAGFESKQGPGYRLPAEAEWEFACRAGTTTRFYRRDAQEAADLEAWINDNSAWVVHPVGLREPNAFGLFDMLGNTAEATLDSERQRPALKQGETPEVYTIPNSPPLSETGSYVLRGGDIMSPAQLARTAFRWKDGDKLGLSSRVGFRVVLPVESARKFAGSTDSLALDVNVAHRRAASWLRAMKTPCSVVKGAEVISVESNSPLPGGEPRLNDVCLYSPQIDALRDKLAEEVEAHLRGTTFRSLDLRTTALNLRTLKKLTQLPAIRSVEHLNVGTVWVSDAMLAEIVKLPQLTSLYIETGGLLTDQGIARLQACSHLKSIKLLQVKLGPKSIEQLGRIQTLERVHLHNSPMTAEHAKAFSQLKFTDLSLAGGDFNDECARQLSGMGRLIRLGVYHNPLTDEGLMALSQIKTLKELDITATQITAAGVAKFRTALPDCRILGKD